MTAEPIPLTSTDEVSEAEAQLLKDKAYNQAIGLLLIAKTKGHNFILHINDGDPKTSVGLQCCSEEFFADAMIQMHNDLHESHPQALAMVSEYLSSKCDCDNCKRKREDQKKHVN